MPRHRRQILPFRIPFFRIWYSTTYTIVFLITLVFLAITPGSLLFEAIENNAWQYVFIIGGVYILTAVLTIFIYSSRLYSNRSVLAGVGKAYIPVEDGEVGKGVRKLIIGQIERSAIVAWESKPRDAKGELSMNKQVELLTDADKNDLGEVEILGTIVPVNVEDPPWGDVQHPGWTAPSHAKSRLQSNLQFETVIKELPNLLEARAVSLAPLLTDSGAQPDPRIVSVLRRQEKMGLREYLTQLSFLRLVDLNGDGRDLLDIYERARFSGRPTVYHDFTDLMLVFGNVMDGMKQLDPDIAEQIKLQVTETIEAPQAASYHIHDSGDSASMVSASSRSAADISPVTARTRITTPYLPQINISGESFASVLRQDRASLNTYEQSLRDNSTHVENIGSDAGSVIHRSL